MRRALLATAGTVAAVVAILQYKSSGTFKAASGSLLPSADSPSASSAPASSSTGASSGTSPTGSTPTTTPSTTTPSRTAAAGGGANGQFNGSDVTFAYGEIEARLTFRNGKIVSVDYPIDTAPDPRSEMINSDALPILTEELLRAQNLHIDGVSGATFTSNAFAQTVSAALSRAGK